MRGRFEVHLRNLPLDSHAAPATVTRAVQFADEEAEAESEARALLSSHPPFAGWGADHFRASPPPFDSRAVGRSDEAFHHRLQTVCAAGYDSVISIIDTSTSGDESEW